MCSILAILDLKSDATQLRRTAIRLSKLQRHRGPDWSGVFCDSHAILAHERLAIVDVTHGAQPLLNATGTHVLAINGEIYNHRDLRAALRVPYAFQTASDCEIILPLYRDEGVNFLERLSGIFAFVLYDAERRRYLIARDHIGICPLYMGEDDAGNVYVASEMKALVPVCTSLWEFPPGHYLDSEVGEPQRYYQRSWREFSNVETNSAEPLAIRAALRSAVERQLMSDVPYGVLLSGGLDSSVIAATAKTFAARRVEEHGRSPAWWPQLHSFSIGLASSPDLVAARRVAEHIASIHHEFNFTVQEGFDALSDVIYHLETYDVTTIRAATPMYLMARRIRAMGVKMVLSGEGADEVFGGYLYFHRAPNARAFHEETIRKLDRLHLYDCLRANKAMAAWGVEARVPFLDKEFLDTAMSIAPAAKMAGAGKMEKHILREAFAEDLPPEIVWRQKEQFSDGVGYDWIDSLRAQAEAEISDRAFATAHVRFPYNPPATKEAYFYRVIFADHFSHAACARCVPGGASVACSTAEALAWDASLAATIDPSGRAVKGVHAQAY
jgi:asparagine synthase (glutamine-hydrolysing)